METYAYHCRLCNALDESLSNYTLCFKHSISITPSSPFDKFADLQWNFCGSYVILYF